MIGFRLYLFDRSIPEVIISLLSASHQNLWGVTLSLTICKYFVITCSPARFTTHDLLNPSFHSYLLSSLLKRRIVLFISICLSIYLCISIWTHGLLSYAMGYNPLLFLFILMFKLFQIYIEETLQFGFLFLFWYVSIIIDFLFSMHWLINVAQVHHLLFPLLSYN